MGELLSHGHAEPQADIYEIVLGRARTDEEVLKEVINFPVESLKTALEKFRQARPDAPAIEPISIGDEFGGAREQLAVIIDGQTIFMISGREQDSTTQE